MKLQISNMSKHPFFEMWCDTNTGTSRYFAMIFIVQMIQRLLYHTLLFSWYSQFVILIQSPQGYGIKLPGDTMSPSSCTRIWTSGAVMAPNKQALHRLHDITSIDALLAVGEWFSSQVEAGSSLFAIWSAASPFLSIPTFLTWLQLEADLNDTT
jgi:hypothetical protein